MTKTYSPNFLNLNNQAGRAGKISFLAGMFLALLIGAAGLLIVWPALSSGQPVGLACGGGCQPEPNYCPGADLVVDVYMKVVGENCHSSGHNSQSTSVNLPQAGQYSVAGVVDRGNPGQCQTNEDFYLEIGGQTGPATEDDAEACAISTREDQLGQFDLTSGNNTVIMRTASACPPDTHSNSVTLKKLCFYFEEPEAVCGNGEVEEAEQCDEGQDNGTVCQAGYGQSCSYCSNSCTEIEINGPYCGDGVINGDEGCDDGPDGSASCGLDCQPVETGGPSGSITACKYEDSDGLASTTDDRLLLTDPAWTMVLDDGQSQTELETDNGCAVFSDLAFGDYTVSEQGQSGWQPVSAVSQEVTISQYQPDQTVSFANQRLAVSPELSSIQVCKYLDTDGLASTTADRLLATSTAWSFNLFDLSATSTAATTDGCAMFSDLPEGDYIVTENLPAGWRLIEPQGGAETIAIADGEDVDVYFVNFQEPGQPQPGPICGNNIKETGEQCDGTDGVPGGNTCTSECRLEAISGGGGGNGNGGGGGSTGGGNGGGGGVVIQDFNLSNVQASPGCAQATISWQTNQFADSRVIYNTSSRADISGQTAPNYGYGFSSALVPDQVTTHSLTLSNLNFNTAYFIRPLSVSGGGSAKVGQEVSFTTLPADQCVLGETGQPLLTIAKTAAREFANPGDQNIAYTVTVSNSGNLTAFAVVLNDSLPEGLLHSLEQSRDKTVELGNLEPGENRQVIFTVDVAGSAQPGVYTNTATASAANHDPTSATAELEVRTVEVLGEELPGTGFNPSELVLLLITLCTASGASLFLRRLAAAA